MTWDDRVQSTETKLMELWIISVYYRVYTVHVQVYRLGTSHSAD